MADDLQTPNLLRSLTHMPQDQPRSEQIALRSQSFGQPERS